jgi:maleate isomerase
VRAARGGGDAVFVSCTNFRAGEAIDDIKAATGLPVVTANQATFQACLNALRPGQAAPGPASSPSR